jgi:hypothetical protein
MPSFRRRSGMREPVWERQARSKTVMSSMIECPPLIFEPYFLQE